MTPSEFRLTACELFALKLIKFRSQTEQRKSVSHCKIGRDVVFPSCYPQATLEQMEKLWKIRQNI